MAKVIEFSNNIRSLLTAYPELREILQNAGFRELVSDQSVKLMGEIMTIPRAANVKNIDMGELKKTLESKGFTVKKSDAQTRQERLRGMLQRLHAGEAVESVRRDFMKEFKDVSAEEIATAEQGLIKGGVPVQDVQRLCDLHSALFHENGEPGCHPHVMVRTESGMESLPSHHPLRFLQRENQALLDAVDAAQQAVKNGAPDAIPAFIRLNAIRGHYAAKEELLMSVLYDYGVTGPSQVMWGVDDEIKREIGTVTSALKDDADNLALYSGRMTKIFERIREMAVKEDRILFPLSLRFFTKEQWYRVYGDLPEMGNPFGIDLEPWPEAEDWLKKRDAAALDGKIKLPTGELTLRELGQIFALMPVDITYIDATDTVRFFMNEGRVFTRPKTALGRDVFRCHPPEIIPVVRQLLSDFKAKRRDHLQLFRRIKGMPVSVRYQAIYDDEGNYTGTVEFVQNLTDAVAAFTKRK